MSGVLTTLIFGFFKFLKYPFILLGILIAVFTLICLGFVAYYHYKGYRFKKGAHQPYTKPSFFKRVFFLFPGQLVLDAYNRDPDAFPVQGLIVYTGRQGYGKTISMLEFVRRLQDEYPLCKVITNVDYRYQDAELKHWKQLVNYKNGVHGVIVVMDELQNWFSCNQSKNFPPEMLQVITQNRKNRRLILGTAQNFYLLSKAIRSQCTEVRECFTIGGCLTVVRRREPFLDSEGNVAEWKNRGMYFYVHSPRLRESYDTYKVIESLSKSGFIEQKEVYVK